MSELRAIPGLAMYQASSDGRIWSRYSSRFLAVRTDRDGYLRTSFGHGSSELVHQLVAAAFHGARPDGMQVRHLDGDKLNNAPGNLAYGTPRENQLDRLVHEGTLHRCCRGHEFTPENTSYESRGPARGRSTQRRCRECRRMRRRARMTKSPAPE